MDLLERVKRQENLHIVFWLIKDSCWMLEIKWLGALMAGPALFMAIMICFLTRKSLEFYINLAIFFWISANSYWMMVEFFAGNAHKNLAGIPFALGFVCVGIYYYQRIRARKADQ
jgi:hypothetical protein